MVLQSPLVIGLLLELLLTSPLPPILLLQLAPPTRRNPLDLTKEILFPTLFMVVVLTQSISMLLLPVSIFLSKVLLLTILTITLCLQAMLLLVHKTCSLVVHISLPVHVLVLQAAAFNVQLIPAVKSETSTPP